MVHQDPTARPTSKQACIYWSGTACTATSKFSEDDISCYHESNCNGFGTCRGCSKYDRGGLKLSVIDNDGNVQQPMNLTMYNIRAKVKPCCHWEGETGTFSASASGDTTPKYDSPDISEVIGGTDTVTSCTISEAAPWQVAFTEDNPSAYGCNGAKSECPYYTGPKFTELVDAKMDTGDRVTAKQVLELRFYSADWASFSDPRGEYEKRFSRPDIWAWAKDNSYVGPSALIPGKIDGFSKPIVQKVHIANLSSDTPTFTVDPPMVASTGTPSTNRPPAFPDLIKELQDAAASLSILWPKGTTANKPFIRNTFTEPEMFMYIAVQLNTDREAFAINLSKHAQNNDSDTEFVLKIKQQYPEDVITDTSTGLPGETFVVPLHLDGEVSTLNHIRVFLDTGSTDESMLTVDVFVQHEFHHAEVAQTYFIDKFGHTQVDPWIDKFTDIEIKAEFKHLTNNTSVHNVLWNTVASNGKKTIVALEKSQFLDSGSDNLRMSWSPIGCASVEITLLDKEVNRVYPWRAWGNDLNGEEIGVWLNRESNSNLVGSEETNVKLELAFASTKGTSIPANVVIFKLPSGQGFSSIDKDEDTIEVRYAYTEYKQGPLPADSEGDLKYNEDLTKVITSLPYQIDFNDSEMKVEGTFVKVGELKIRSCEDVLGDCYTRKAEENEELAISSFFSGGLSEDSVKTTGEMLQECRDVFDGKHTGSLFDDGTQVSYAKVVDRITDLSLQEGSFHYNVIFSDRDGRPIGTKRIGFLSQSSLVQTRDVEIKYQWASYMQHYPIKDSFFVSASSHSPTYATRESMTKFVYQYEPMCGDHNETSTGSLFTEFDLQKKSPGALWYPYKQCLAPIYHVSPEEWWSPISYTDRVEGFGANKRGFYWERMRFFDQYTPAIMYARIFVGCVWQETTTTANAIRPVMFTGYTKIRSDHLFGAYSTDRESLRVSRHWEKRQLSVRKESILANSDGDITVQLTPEFRDLLLDSDGNLKTGVDTATPIWSHMSDGYTVVVPANEKLNHPFSRYLLSNVGTYAYEEKFTDEKHQLADVFIERDYTSNTSRNTDGSVIHIPEDTTSNSPTGQLGYTPGREVRWVFVDEAHSWAWMPIPEKPLRSPTRVTGVTLSNVGYTFFKKNRVSATHPAEGNHTLKYTAHVFADDGSLSSPATLSLDNGPVWNISQTDGQIYVTDGSPYLTELHENEEHDFSLYGPGPGGSGLLADNRGLQLFEVDGQKKSTYAGVVINTIFDINELPYQVVDLTSVSRLNDVQEGSLSDKVSLFSRVYTPSDLTPETLSLDFSGHYYVEDVSIIFRYGSDLTDVSVTDIPVINISGEFKLNGEASPTTEQDIHTTSYVTGSSLSGLQDKEVSFSIKQRLFSLSVSLGARAPGNLAVVSKVSIRVREHGNRSETIVTYGPTLNTSSATVGTHKPSDLEFYFQRSEPDFGKNNQSGIIPLEELNVPTYDVQSGPVAEVKFLGRAIKDLIPMFNFTGFDVLYPYDNIDLTTITGYTESLGPAGQQLRYIDSNVNTSSKGWTISTSKHYSDPFHTTVATDNGPEGIPNSQPEIWPNEDLQEYLYNHASSFLGTTTTYNSFWHPEETKFFLDKAGIDLDTVTWELRLQSTVAPLDRVLRDTNYGCHLPNTNEELDGKVHKIPNWQAKGVFHYLCDPKYSWECLTVVMDKCNEFMFRSYGTAEYSDNNVVDRFSYKFEFPPSDRMAYISRGLIVTNAQGGTFNGPGGGGLFGANNPLAPTRNQVFENYSSDSDINGG